MRFTVAVVDPSLFTLPYDLALCGALAASGCGVTLYGRRLRRLETTPLDMPVTPLFYRRSEPLKALLPGQAFRLIKALEHWRDMRRLVAVFRRAKPDVVHVQWAPLPSVDLAAIRRIRALGIPTVLTVHDIAPLNDSPGAAFQRLGLALILQVFDHLIVHTAGSKDVLVQRGIAAGKVSVIPHGVLPTASAAPVAPRPGPRTILLFGRIRGYKGVDVMIEALGLLPDAVRRLCRVLIVGEPMIPVEAMRQRAAVLGVAESIVWDLRYVSDADMAAVFSQADIFAFPYREIDTSGVLMACLPFGKPIVASRIGAFGQLIEDGVHGHVVPPGDPAALARALEAMITDPAACDTYGRNVAALGQAIPAWEAIADRTVALYRRLRKRQDTLVGTPAAAVAEIAKPSTAAGSL